MTMAIIFITMVIIIKSIRNETIFINIELNSLNLKVLIISH